MTIPFRRSTDVLTAAAAVRLQFAAHGLIACPTETVYGLGCALTDAGLAAVDALKGRDPEKPSILLVSSLAMLAAWGFRLDGVAEQLAETFWPGPLTLVLPNADERLPARLRNTRGGVGVRWTPHAGAAGLAAALGHPLVSTSANPSGQPPAETAGAVAAYFPEAFASRHLLILDGGAATVTTPSTVVDCVGVPTVLREGAITRAQMHPYLPS